MFVLKVHPYFTYQTAPPFVSENVLISSYVNLTQMWVIYEEGTSVKKMLPFSPDSLDF